VRVGDHHAGATEPLPRELLPQEWQLIEDNREILAGLVGLAKK
jgi:hypothetical protein